MKKGILLLALCALGVNSAYGLSMWQKAKWVVAQGAVKASLALVEKAKTAPAQDKANYTLAAEKSVDVVKDQLRAFAADAKDADINRQVAVYIAQLDTAVKSLKTSEPVAAEESPEESLEEEGWVILPE